MNSIKDTLNEVFGNDVAGIIVEFAYPKCFICEFRYDECELKNMWDYKDLCVFCAFINGYKPCNNCDLYFHKTTNIFCFFCQSPCKFYCPKCKIYDDLTAIDLAMNILNHTP